MNEEQDELRRVMRVLLAGGFKMKIWKRYDTRPLKPDQEAERKALGLDTPTYKLLLFVREAGDEGVKWGSLPSIVSQRLVTAGLINLRWGAVRVTDRGRAK